MFYAYDVVVLENIYILVTVDVNFLKSQVVSIVLST